MNPSPKSLTENFYDAASDEWDATRRNSWGEFEFARDFLSSKKILDAGCGNGRLVGWLRENDFRGEYFGVDASEKLIEKAKQNFPSENFSVADLREFSLPEKFDAIFSVAVLHHLTNFADQKKVVENLFASLNSGGRIFVTTWNVWQPRFWKYFRGSRILEIPFAKKGSREVFAFTPRKLKKLFESAGFTDVEVFFARHSEKSNFYRGRNLVIRANKK